MPAQGLASTSLKIMGYSRYPGCSVTGLHCICLLVIDLIYWRCLKKTGIVVATGLVLLFSLTMYTFLSVVTFFSMALLTVSLLYRVGMTVMGAIQKSGTENPFKYVEKLRWPLFEEICGNCTQSFNIFGKRVSRMPSLLGSNNVLKVKELANIFTEVIHVTMPCSIRKHLNVIPLQGNS